MFLVDLMDSITNETSDDFFEIIQNATEKELNDLHKPELLKQIWKVAISPKSKKHHEDILIQLIKFGADPCWKNINNRDAKDIGLTQIAKICDDKISNINLSTLNKSELNELLLVSIVDNKLPLFQKILMLDPNLKLNEDYIKKMSDEMFLIALNNNIQSTQNIDLYILNKTI